MTSTRPITINEHGVPVYPRGHVGRLLVCLAAIDKLERPTATSVAGLTSLSKGKIDEYVAALAAELGVKIRKDGPVYTLESWGPYLKATAVRTCLKVQISDSLQGIAEDTSPARSAKSKSALQTLLNQIPQQPQSDQPTEKQLAQLSEFAKRLGFQGVASVMDGILSRQ